MTKACDDNAFGPIISGCRGNFDFTLLFEQIIFALTLSLLVSVASSWRILLLARQPNKTAGGSLLVAKIVNALALVAGQVALLIVWSQIRERPTGVYVTARLLGLISALQISLLSFLEHKRTIKPSGTLCYCLLAVLAADAIQARTLWLKSGHHNVAIVMTVNVTSRLCLLILESWNKDALIFSSYRSAPKEMRIGVFDRAVFWWLTPLLKTGWLRVLEYSDLLALDHNLEVRTLTKVPKSKFRKGRASVFWTLASRLRWEVLMTLPPRIFLSAFNLSQPFLIQSVIDFVGAPRSNFSRNTGYGLIAEAAIIYIGIAVSTGFYKHKVYRSIVAARGVLTAMIYDTTLTLPSNAIDQTAALTLMNTDIERICFGMQYMHEMWASTVEVAVAIYLLERQVGLASIVPAIIVLGSGALVYHLAKLSRVRQTSWNEAVERRVSETTEILGMIRGAKLIGMVEHLFRHIQQLRRDELEICKGFRRLQVFKNVLANSSTLAAPVLTFAVVYATNHRLNRPFVTTSQAFTALAIIQLVSSPLTVVLNAFPSFTASLGCLDRISRYIDNPDKRDNSSSFPPGAVAMDRSSVLRVNSSPSFTAFSATIHRFCGHGQVSSTSDGLSPNLAGHSQPEENSILSAEYNEKLRHPDVTSHQKAIVTLTDCSVMANLKGSLTLHNLNFKVQPATIVALLGPVGCGKSSLLKAILGEYALCQGTLERTTNEIAFCDQSPWLRNAGIKDNILCDAPEDRQWYESTIEACGLASDIARLPHGDATCIGNKGAMLSGGQKQRLALARACYSRKKLILLDDVFSGLDQGLQQSIFTRLLGPTGLFRYMGATVILATHAAHLAQRCDYALVLSENGGILKEGRPKDISFSSSISEQENAISPKTEEAESKADIPKDQDHATDTSSEDNVALDRSRQSGDWFVYWFYIKSMDYRFAVAFFVLFAVETAFEKFPQVWLSLFITSENHHPGRYLSMYFGVYAAFAVLGLSTLGLTIWFWFVVILPKSANNLHQTLLNAVERAPLWFFSNTDIGTIINRFSQDMELVDMALPLAFFQTIFGVLTCLATIILIATGGQFVAIAIPFSLGFVYLLQTFYLRTSRQMRLLDLEARSPLYTHFLETIQGLDTIRAFGWQDADRKRNHHYLDESQKPFYLLYCIQRWLNLVLDMFVAVLAIIVITMATQLRERTNEGTIGLALVNILSFNVSLAELIDAWTIMETSLGSVARVKAFVETAPSEPLPISPVQLSPQWPSEGQITVQNVTCSYEPSTPSVLKDISFTIKPGQRLGICGRSGSGKSSLILALLGLLDLETGSITIDDLPTTELSTQTLASRIVVLPQEAFLRATTIRDNMDPHHNLSDSTLLSALAKVELATLIQSFPTGLDTQVRDLALSAGQRQLLALAISLLKTSRVLVLDEATSNVDSETEALMRRVIRTEFAGWTVVEVTHRIESILDADVVAVLQAGRLVELGKPSELMARMSALREMWDTPA